MRTRIYLNGKPDWTDEGPGFARRQGHGGSALGHFSGITLKASSSQVRSAAAQQGLERKRVARAGARVT